MGSDTRKARRAADNVAYIKAPGIDIPNITLVEMFNAAAQGNDGRVAIDFLGKKTTYMELDDASDRVARGLQDRGFKKGDKVVFYMPNSSYYITLMFGIWKAGGIVVNMRPESRKDMKGNPDFYKREVRERLQKTKALFIATLDLPEYLDVCDEATFGTKTQNIIVCPMAKALPPVKETFYPALMKLEPAKEALKEKASNLKNKGKDFYNALTWQAFKDRLELMRDKAEYGWRGTANFLRTLKIYIYETKLSPNYLRFALDRYLPTRTSDHVQTPAARPEKKAIERCGAPMLDYWDMTGNNGLYEPQKLDPSDTALLQPTNGTTGDPKLVELTHKNLVANVMQSIYQYTGHLHVDPHGDQREIIANPLPFAHIFSFTVGALYPLMTGAELATVPDPRETTDVLSMINRTEATALLSAPKLLKRIAEHDATPCYNLKSCKTSIAGGEALAPNVVKSWEEATGLIDSLFEGFGQSEAGPVICSNAVRYGNKPGAMGHLFAGMEARIVSTDDTGRLLNRGLVGRLQVRGPNVMKGYFKDQAETGKVLSADGWLTTGDLCMINADGSITHHGREKRVANINGIKISAEPIELKLQSEASVAEAVVITVADSSSTQALKAIVRLRDGAAEDRAAEHLKAHLLQALGKYSVPKHIEFVKDPLPMKAGKTDYLLLQTQHWNRHLEKAAEPVPTIQ